jgi:hypothetical protein
MDLRLSTAARGGRERCGFVKATFEERTSGTLPAHLDRDISGRYTERRSIGPNLMGLEYYVVYSLSTIGDGAPYNAPIHESLPDYHSLLSSTGSTTMVRVIGIPEGSRAPPGLF